MTTQQTCCGWIVSTQRTEPPPNLVLLGIILFSSLEVTI
jgi:hypothetical protein